MINLLSIIATVFLFYFVYTSINPEEYVDKTYMGRANRFATGSYVLYSELESIGKYDMVTLDSTAFQILNADTTFQNMIYIFSSDGSGEGPQSIDLTSQKKILEWVGEGGTLFLCSQLFEAELILDSLGIELRGDIFDEVRIGPAYYGGKPEFNRYGYKIENEWINYVHKYDEFRSNVVLSIEESTPISIYTPFGEGYIIYTPYFDLFDNYNMIARSGHLVSQMISFMQPGKTLWIDKSPVNDDDGFLRVVQRGGPLSWAYYTALIGSILFLVSNSRRRQRAVPVLEEKTNDTLLLATNISKMYRQSEGYHKLAVKRYKHWLLFVQRKFGIRLAEQEEDNPLNITRNPIGQLSKKSGYPETAIKRIINDYRRITISNREGKISRKQFMEFNNLIDGFYKSTK
jgi:hypothetical protein